jgi:hypothetical protein
LRLITADNLKTNVGFEGLLKIKCKDIAEGSTAYIGPGQLSTQCTAASAPLLKSHPIVIDESDLSTSSRNDQMRLLSEVDWPQTAGAPTSTNVQHIIPPLIDCALSAHDLRRAFLMLPDPPEALTPPGMMMNQNVVFEKYEKCQRP